MHQTPNVILMKLETMITRCVCVALTEIHNALSDDDLQVVA